MFQATTIVCVRRSDQLAIAGDGQVTLQNTIVKNSARKVRLMGNDKVLAGFAGSAADGLTLFEMFDDKLGEFGGNVRRAAVELARAWRGDKFLRKLEAMMIVADKDSMLLLSGNGDVLEPDHEVTSIGSGAGFAQAAARALLENTDLDAPTIARKAIEIASQICIYTNDNITVLTLDR